MNNELTMAEKTYTPPDKPITEYTDAEVNELFDQPITDDDLSEYVIKP